MGVVPVLQPLLETPVAPYMAGMLLGDTEALAARPATDLLQPEVMEAAMQKFRPEDWKQDPRAVFSHWTQFYFLLFLPPALAANLLYQQELPLALEDVAVTLGDDGLPLAFILKNEGVKLDRDVEASERFQLLRERHLAPLITTWSRQARLSERVLWSNAGRYLDWILREFQEHVPAAEVWRPLQIWLETPYDRLGWHRRICCLRDRLAGVTICPDCPKVAHV